MNDTPLRTIEQFGWLIRCKRNERKLSQAALARMLGVERKSVIRLEAGNSKADLRLLLKVVEALDARLLLADAPVGSGVGASRLDEVFRRLERRDHALRPAGTPPHLPERGVRARASGLISNKSRSRQRSARR